MSAADKGERVVAAFEAAKGLLVLFVGFGLLAVVDEDTQRLAEELVRTLHLNPAKRLPRIFLDAAERAADVRLWMLAALAFGYSMLRLAEAYGLWYGKRWAEWFAVASGALYVPFEAYALWERATWVRAATLSANVAIVAYVGLTLWRRMRERAPPAPHGPAPPGAS
ncbi:MAG TPA: DUF2127 domain-containing protein [Casimicrobiaceae bacterium]|nr:DUF2127 domain-containing protein [Casimicrobiaceae bacterium]